MRLDALQLLVRVRVERAHDEHEHALEIDRARREVACPEEEDRAAARVDARAVEELQRLEVGQVRQPRALEEGAVGRAGGGRAGGLTGTGSCKRSAFVGLVMLLGAALACLLLFRARGLPPCASLCAAACALC